MFNKIDKTFYDGRPVSETFQMETESEKHNQIGIKYSDNKEPNTEVMHVEEWEQMKSEDLEKSKMRADKFQDATDGVQSRILGELEQFNPRWGEAINIIQRVADRLGQIKEELLNHVYGTSDFQTQLNVKILKDKMNEFEIDPDVSGLTPFQADFIELLAKHEVTLDTINRMSFVQEVIQRLNGWQEKVVEKFIDTPLQNWRIDDIVQVLEPVYKEKAEKEAETLQDSKNEV